MLPISTLKSSCPKLVGGFTSFKKWKSNRIRWAIRAQAARLLNQGRDCLSRNNTAGLQSVVRQLWDLSAERSRRGSQARLSIGPNTLTNSSDELPTGPVPKDFEALDQCLAEVRFARAAELAAPANTTMRKLFYTKDGLPPEAPLELDLLARIAAQQGRLEHTRNRLWETALQNDPQNQIYRDCLECLSNLQNESVAPIAAESKSFFTRQPCSYCIGRFSIPQIITATPERALGFLPSIHVFRSGHQRNKTQLVSAIPAPRSRTATENNNSKS